MDLHPVDIESAEDIPGHVPYFDLSNFTRPIIVGGCHGGGTSLTSKTLRHLGVFMGRDIEKIQARKYHESRIFLDIQELFLKTLFPERTYGMVTNSDEEWQEYWSRLESPKHLLRAMAVLNFKEIFEKYSFRVSSKDKAKALSPSFLYGWKNARNSLMIKVWKKLFPQARYLIVYSEAEKKPPVSIEGDWFKNHSSLKTRLTYMFPRYLNPIQDDCFFFNYRKSFSDVNEFNRLVKWLGLKTLSSEEFKAFKQKIHYEG